MNNKSTALIIDDEPDIRELLEITFERMEINCRSAPDLTSAKKLLKQDSFNLCLTDMKLPDGDGVEFVTYVQQNYPQTPIAVITAHGDMTTAIQALKSGAFDFLTKPVDLNILRNIVKSALNLSDELKSVENKLIGESNAIGEIRKTAAKLARSQVPVYISGESGTGKELVARLIHEQGPRANRPFVAVNCGAIPQGLMESEFFGYLKGSFTGADGDKDGLFQAADRGTLFLDEVADLPTHIQVKLLRAIQEKSIRPVGANREMPVDIRLLCATHKDLGQLVEQGYFRQDLYYRINVIELHIPPLRERKTDIKFIVEHILARLNQNTGPALIGIAGDALLALESYSFPGNIRELENVLERAVTLCDDDTITTDDLQLPQKMMTRAPASESDEIVLDSYLCEVEKKVILDALEKHKWNRTATAKSLGISLRALRYRLEKLGID